MTTPILDPRDADVLAGAIVAERPAFAPGWRLEPKSPGWAVVQVYARYLHALGQRIDQAPDKNKLAFLDLLGVSLLRAQPARAPVVFTPLRTGNSRAPAQTRLGAKGAGGTSLVFETQSAIALAAARLSEVWSLWPARDGYVDHTADVLGSRAFTLFEHPSPIRHELYLAHGRDLALAGRSIVELEVELAGSANRAMVPTWEYWDGSTWRAFKDFGTDTGDSIDGTDGLTRSGIIRLVADCAATELTTIAGVTSYWLRARLTAPLPPDASLTLPRVDRLQLHAVIDRALPSPGCARGVLADTAFADGDTLDTTKSFFPLGKHPIAGTSFYFSHAEAFAKPGAQVTVCFDKAFTTQEEGDTLGAGYEVSINAAFGAIDTLRNLMDKAAKALDGIVKAGTGVLNQAFDNLFAQDPQAWWDNVVLTPLEDALDAVKAAAVPDPVNTSLSIIDTLTQVFTFVVDLDDAILNGLTGKKPFPDTQAFATAHTVRYLGRAALAITGDAVLNGKINRLTGAIGSANVGEALAASTDLVDFIGHLPDSIVLPSALPAEIADALTVYDDVKARINTALAEVLSAAANLGDVMTNLAALKPSDLAASRGVTPPAASGPELAWEYFDGRAWRTLVGPVATGPSNFTESGRVSFDVPEDWTESEVNGSSARWMRIRLARGTYDRMRQVSWYDSQSKQVNYITLLESRPPVLDAFRLGYFYRSPGAPPDACVTYGDFQWTDRTRAARWRGESFEPFAPTADRTPALYLGFDRPLPRDLISLFADVDEADNARTAPPMVWEAWDGTNWVRVPVRDDTRDFARPGMIAGVWPAEPPPPPVALVEAEGRSVRMVDAHAAGRFATDDLVVVATDSDMEVACVAGVSGSEVTLQTPLANRYNAGTLQIAGLPRFGTPRTWLRGRLVNDVDPRPVRVRALHLNAVWALHRRAYDNELLGSGRAEPRQTLGMTYTPVLAEEIIEVRELDGARAHVEWPMLRDELAIQGIEADDVRLVKDVRTGRVMEVWVPWRERPTLAFSTPEDRHYLIERATGRIRFGDDRHGRVVPAGTDNVRARRYEAGGGTAGNVGVGAIKEILSGVVAESVTNPRAAQGGADGECTPEVLRRGPRIMRHREQAIAASDYESLAREASPAVAVSRALPVMHPSGRRVPGCVRLIIVPKSAESRPAPTLALRETVQAFIAARCPATAARGLSVTGPTYHPVGVEAVIVPIDFTDAGPVLDRVTNALANFLHPLSGGPRGAGWPFGRGVHLSDVAAVVEGVSGVDYARTLVLVVDGTPVDGGVTVPADRILVAGPLRIRVAGGED